MSGRRTRVAAAGQIREGRSKLVTVEHEPIALWKLHDGRVCAIGNICPHQHFSKLHEGALDGEWLSCPMHGWTFNLHDGCERQGRGKARVFPVEMEGDQIFITMPE